MNITQAQFAAFTAQGYNHIPVTREIITDLETPLSIYLKLADAPYTYLFESVKGGEKWGRYSFIGLPCHTLIQVKNNQLILQSHAKIIEQIATTDPLSWIEKYLQQFRAPEIPGFSIFNGGLVGYFSYDTVRYIETRLATTQLKDPLDNPDILLMLSNEFVVFDTLLNKSYLVVYCNPAEKSAWEKAQQRIDAILNQLKTSSINLPKNTKTTAVENFTSNMSKEHFEMQVKRAVEYMVAGDAMQISLSQRFNRTYTGAPFNFYRALRTVNPSPYMFYLNLGDLYIAGSSPEILVRLEDKKITLRPIAGTRPRGRTLEEDLILEKDLLADPKELAEHLMLIDLGRNDVGRVSETGSVKVTEKMVIERYSHVMHIVSNVIGEIKPNQSALDVLRATFPAGTLTGTPKVRAMEIMDELENVKRGIYSGAVGYLAWNGNMDLAIAIRTVVIKNNTLHVQAGAGLVVDSIPANEWQETMNKAKALLKAADLAETEF